MLSRLRACACTRSPVGVRACARAHVCRSILLLRESRCHRCRTSSTGSRRRRLQHSPRASRTAGRHSSPSRCTPPPLPLRPSPNPHVIFLGRGYQYRTTPFLASKQTWYCTASCVRIVVVVGPLLLSSHTGGRPRGGRFATRRLCLTCRRSRVCFRSRLTPFCLPVWHMCARRSS